MGRLIGSAFLTSQKRQPHNIESQPSLPQGTRRCNRFYLISSHVCKAKIAEPDGIYFITITCFKWVPLFNIAGSHDAVYKWFQYLKVNNHFITGYVIMPNHLHVLIAFSNTGNNINKIIGNGKRFMAYDIEAKLRRKRE